MRVLRGRSVAYFYPGFVLVDGGPASDFAIIDLTELEVSSVATNFTEADTPPTDAQVVGKTWAKANKNGSRDRRFANNRELPILRYGSLHLGTGGGLNEAFMFSDAKASSYFAESVNDVQRLLARGRRPSNQLSDRQLLDRPR